MKALGFTSRYAFDRKRQAGIDPAALGDIRAKSSASLAPDSDPNADEPSDMSEEDSVLDFVASHQSRSDHIDQARRYGECFRLGQTQCDID